MKLFLLFIAALFMWRMAEELAMALAKTSMTGGRLGERRYFASDL
jgi:hypothetical protein